MADKKIGIVLGVSGEQQSAQAIEQVAQRGASAFERMQTSVSRAGNAAEFAEGKIKKLNRGVNDAAGAVQLISPLLGGLGGNFSALSGWIGNASDLFGTFSSVLLKNPLGLAAIAITGAATAYAAYATETKVAEDRSKQFASAIEAAQKAIVSLGDATDPNVQILRNLNDELEKQRKAVEPLVAKYNELAAALAQQNAPIELSAENQTKLAEAYARSTAAGDALKARMEQLSRSNLDAKLFQVTGGAQALTTAMDAANLKLTQGVSVMAQLQAQIDRVNFNKVKDQLELSAQSPAALAQRAFEERKKQIDAFFADGGNDAEFARLAKLNRDKLQADLDALKPAGGGKAEVDPLIGQFERLRAALDPTAAAERELANATLVLEQAQAAGLVTAEEMATLKGRLADKAYEASEAGRAEAAAIADGVSAAERAITPLERYERQIANITKALEAGKLSEEQAARARDQVTKELEKADDDGKQSAKTARELGLAFSSAFEDAVVGGKKMQDVLKGLGQDLLRVFIRKQLTEPLLELFSVVSGGGKSGGGGVFGGLFGGGSSSGSGGGIFGDLFGSIGKFLGFGKGAMFSGGEIVPFAAGGVVSAPTMFPLSRGRLGLMGEAGPEAIMPLERSADGRLGVRGGWGGHQVVINQTIDARNADASIRRELPAMMERTKRETIAAVEQLFDKGGQFARKSGRRSS